MATAVLILFFLGAQPRCRVCTSEKERKRTTGAMCRLPLSLQSLQEQKSVTLWAPQIGRKERRPKKQARCLGLQKQAEGGLDGLVASRKALKHSRGGYEHPVWSAFRPTLPQMSHMPNQPIQRSPGRSSKARSKKKDQAC